MKVFGGSCPICCGDLDDDGAHAYARGICRSCRRALEARTSADRPQVPLSVRKRSENLTDRRRVS